ncbi:hypothetical protein CRUP_023120 [Coryphaenoides rupestris]|nr:hypothetical protein CRUP_023120 [Coryphaenoides rupestris]
MVRPGRPPPAGPRFGPRGPRPHPRPRLLLMAARRQARGEAVGLGCSGRGAGDGGGAEPAAAAVGRVPPPMRRPRLLAAHWKFPCLIVLV